MKTGIAYGPWHAAISSMGLILGFCIWGIASTVTEIRLEDRYRQECLNEVEGVKAGANATLKAEREQYRKKIAGLEEAIEMQNGFLAEARSRAAEWLKQRNHHIARSKKLGIWLPTKYSAADWPDRPPPGELGDPFDDEMQGWSEYRVRNGYWEVRHLQGTPEV